jgi:hypothetical protein
VSLYAERGRLGDPLSHKERLRLRAISRWTPLAVLVVGWCHACASTLATGSVYRSRCVHVGVRPASDAIGDYAVTVQVTTDTPPLGAGCAR